jgi:hypothetical protein
LCLFGLPSEGQTNIDNDWRNLAKLPIGMPISVVEHVRRGCEFIRVTDLELTCERTDALGRTLVIPRGRIHQVRIERPSHNKMIRGAMIGAGLGELLFGVPALRTNDAETRVFGPFFGLGIGAWVGGAIGRHIHEHGAVLYSN